MGRKGSDRLPEADRSHAESSTIHLEERPITRRSPSLGFRDENGAPRQTCDRDRRQYERAVGRPCSSRSLRRSDSHRTRCASSRVRTAQRRSPGKTYAWSFGSGTRGRPLSSALYRGAFLLVLVSRPFLLRRSDDFAFKVPKMAQDL